MAFLNHAKKYTFFGIFLCQSCPLLLVDNFVVKLGTRTHIHRGVQQPPLNQPGRYPVPASKLINTWSTGAKNCVFFFICFEHSDQRLVVSGVPLWVFLFIKVYNVEVVGPRFELPKFTCFLAFYFL